MGARVYGELHKDGCQIRQFWTSIRWGFSQQSLGAIVLMRPIASKFKDPILAGKFNESDKESMFGELEITQEFQQLIDLVELLKKDGRDEDMNLSGKFYIYSLFSNYPGPDESRSVEYFDNSCDSNMLFQFKNKIYPFVIIAWGYNRPTIRIKNIRDFRETKRKWLKAMENYNTYGVPGQDELSYLSPFRRKPDALVEYNSKILSQIKEKERSDCEETTVVLSSSKARMYSRSELFSFEHLSINEQYELAGYPNMWAYPKGSQIPNEPREKGTNYLRMDLDLPKSPKPEHAKEPMVAIEGDRTPESYLEAAIFYHRLNDLAMNWHGGTWRNVTLLPEESARRHKNIDWNMYVPEPEIWEPQFRISKLGKPIVIFYTLSEEMPSTISLNTHVFSDVDYTLRVISRTIATAEVGYVL